MGLTNKAFLVDLHRKEAINLTELAGAKEVLAARAILAAIEAERDKLRAKVEENPKLCDGDLKEDMRCLNAQAAILTQVLALPEAAREIIKSSGLEI